ncbi:MAG: hypothetical protein P8O91_08405, partial [Luminiphilus sp.]|nr:hypothetical protein [Luminiphilus sp.]
WTMNVIEVLLILGALWGLRHSMAHFKAGESVYLGFWLASVIFMLALEIPVYFPEKLGAPDNALFFIHNEFSVQFFFGRAPLYILALYPAIMYASFVLVRQAGLFDQRGGALIGALGVGVVHHVFYEIFDHFGPQYGWWTWNYPNFTSSLASVPVSSMVSFAFVGPIALTLATQLLVPKSVVTQDAQTKPESRRVRGFVLGTLLAGLLTPIIFVLLTLNTWFSVLGIDLTPRLEMLASVAIVGTALGLTLRQFLRLTTFSTQGLWRYSRAYFALFLSVFSGLWFYALPNYLSATDGLTPQGFPVGSLAYVLGCMAFALFFLLREKH